MKLYKETKKYQLNITNKLEAKIRLLCEKINTVEWSGIVFYDIEGTLKDDNLVITAVDLFLMHKGTAGYTEFEITPDIAHYMAMNDLIEYKQGLIHSHNNMSTFFSGTDQNTLLELGSKQRHFFSLIVNNEGTYTAGITKAVLKKRKVEETRTIYTFDDELIEETVPEYREEEVTDVHYYELDINYAEEMREFMDRISVIEKESINTPTYSSYSSYGNKFGNYSSNYARQSNLPFSGTSGYSTPNYTKKSNSTGTTINSLSEEEIKEVMSGMIQDTMEEDDNELYDISNRVLKSVLVNMNYISKYYNPDLTSSFLVFTNRNINKNKYEIIKTVSTILFDLLNEFDTMISDFDRYDVVDTMLSMLKEYPNNTPKEALKESLELIMDSENKFN